MIPIHEILAMGKTNGNFLGKRSTLVTDRNQESYEIEWDRAPTLEFFCL